MLGQFVAGDEKLFKWTGESMWVRKCPGKDDKLSLWNYELVAELFKRMAWGSYSTSCAISVRHPWVGGCSVPKLFKTGGE